MQREMLTFHQPKGLPLSRAHNPSLHRSLFSSSVLLKGADRLTSASHMPIVLIISLTLAFAECRYNHQRPFEPLAWERDWGYRPEESIYPYSTLLHVPKSNMTTRNCPYFVHCRTHRASCQEEPCVVRHSEKCAFADTSVIFCPRRSSSASVQGLTSDA